MLSSAAQTQMLYGIKKVSPLIFLTWLLLYNASVGIAWIYSLGVFKSRTFHSQHPPLRRGNLGP